MLSLGRIQMLLYFSLEDGSKKMAGTGVVKDGRNRGGQSEWNRFGAWVENLLQLLGASPSVRVNPY